MISAPSTPPCRLLLGDPINPPGNWSSDPPHKHDRQRPPEEVRLQEVYFYKSTRPAASASRSAPTTPALRP